MSQMDNGQELVLLRLVNQQKHDEIKMLLSVTNQLLKVAMVYPLVLLQKLMEKTQLLSVLMLW